MAVWYRYDCCGMLVESEFELPAPAVGPEFAGLAAELRFVSGEDREAPILRPSEDVVAELQVDGMPRYSFCRVEGGYIGRIYGVVDYVVSEDLSQVTCHLIPGAEQGYVPIIAAGTVVAFVMSMRGKCVVHGSAVDLGAGRGAIAFAGISGQGKSTMAAIMCAAGGLLVTDDVMAVGVERSAEGRLRAVADRGGHELRLRPKAQLFAEIFDPSARNTVDDRKAAAPPRSTGKTIELEAIAIPWPVRDSDQVVARRLGAGEASMALAKYNRIDGWRDPAMLKRQFADAVAIAEAVPVFELKVPWGPPFAEDLARRVANACELGDPFAKLSRVPT